MVRFSFSQHLRWLISCSILIGLGSTFLPALERSGGITRCLIQEQKFHSKSLPRGSNGPKLIRYRILFPKNYQPHRKHSVVYFLHGRGGSRFILDALDFCDRLDAWVDQGGSSFLVVAPDGENSYWMNGAHTGLRWGDAITQDLIEEVESKFPVIPAPQGRLIAGISMGGHGAIQLDLNYPGIYGAIAAHSAVFRTQEEASREFRDEFGTGEDYRRRDPFSIMMIQGKRPSGPVWLDMGQRDPWLKNTLNFANFLHSLPVAADLHVGEDAMGGHDMGYWKHHLPSYIEWYARHLSPPN